MISSTEYYSKPILKTLPFYVVLVFFLGTVQMAIVPLKGWHIQNGVPFYATAAPAVLAALIVAFAYVVVQHARIRKSLGQSEPTREQIKLLDSAYHVVTMFYLLCGAITLFAIGTFHH